MKNSSFNEALMALRQQEEVPLIKIAKDPVLASVVSKLVDDPYHAVVKNRKGDREPAIPNLGEARQVSQNKMQDITDAESVMQLLPDLELAAQILVSSIISPKDMMTTELIFTPSMDLVPPSVASTMTNAIREYISGDYKIEARLPTMLRDMLFNTGSYPLAVIPENALDEIINSPRGISTESLSEVMNLESGTIKSRGILGSNKEITQNKKRFSLEDYSRKDPTDIDSRVFFRSINLKVGNENIEIKPTEVDGDLFTVTDAPEALSLPNLIASIKQREVSQAMGSIAMEAFGSLNDTTLENLIYQKTNYEVNNVVRVKTSDQAYRTSVGEPLIMHIPSEAVIPVYVPGSPSNHIGYFVLTDNNGHPVTRASELDHYSELSNMTMNNRKSMASTLIEKASQMWFGSNQQTAQRERMDFAARMYGEIIETDLLNRLKNGIYGQSVKIGSYTEVYRVMFSRALQQQQTQFVFIPSDLMTYMAFKHDNNGVGYSLLDNMKVVNSLAVHLMLADVRASVMNSINRTKVNVRMDEDEPNTIKRREEIVHEYLNLRSAGNNGMPMGTSNPSEITQWANTAGVEFSFSGATDLPDMEIDISEYQTNMAKPDSELRDELKRLRINGVGLSPETVDQGMGANFATTIIQESLMLAKRVYQYQQEFCPQLSDHISKIALNSPKVMEELITIVLDNFEDIIKLILPEQKDIQMDDLSKRRVATRLAVAFISKLEVSLPKPDSLTTKVKSDAFQEYMSSLETAIDYYLSTEAVPSQLVGDEFASVIDEAKSALLKHYGRMWMAENDHHSELADLVSTDSDDKPLIDVYQLQVDHAEVIARALASMKDKAKPLVESVTAYAQANDVDELEGSSDYGSDNNDDMDTEDTGGDDLGGDMNFDFEDENDFSLEIDESSDNSTPEEEPTE